MYEEDGNENDSLAPNILYALKRYRWHLCMTVIPLLTAAVAVIVSLPPIFLSQGVVLVETQQIPDDLVRSTVTSAASERIQVIKARVMTRDKLLAIIEKYPYFPLDRSDPLETAQLLDQVREAVEIDLIESRGVRRSGPDTAIAFTVGFNSKNAFIAQAVANDLVTLFLSENVRSRTERASETTDFLQREAEKIKDELDETEAAVAEYKQRNKNALPEHLDLYVDMREQTTRRLEDIDRDIRSTNDQIDLLTTQMALRSQNPAAAGSRAQRLAELKTRYHELSLIYKPTYPDLVAIREQIEVLESDTSPSGDPLFSEGELAVERQLSSLRGTVEALLRERREVEEKLADLESRILNIPIVERGLTALNRDYQAKLEQYNDVRSKTMEASMAESLEEGRKAERFSILEPPILPTIPVAPDRRKLLVLGVAGAFGMPFGIVFLIGFLDKTIRSKTMLTKTLGGVSVIETPFVATENERLSRRKQLKIALSVVAAVSLAALLAIHFFFMPLGLFASKFLARFGVY